MSAATIWSDQVLGPMEVYAHAKAWFMTLAFVTVRKQSSWFDLQTAVFASDRSNDVAPPIDHFSQAWARTI